MRDRTLLVTDIHLSNKRFRGVSLLDIQVECINSIIDKEKPTEIIIMGDIFMQRKPSPSAMLSLRRIIKRAEKYASSIVLLRGNHDSENKSDDGVTALTVFESATVKVVTSSWIDTKKKRAYIPHYENQSSILSSLEGVPKGYSVFGHFGFVGCLNSLGDHDFNIPLDKFNNRTYLGHIHNHYSNWNGENQITVVGTPYSTNFGEQGRTCFYGIKDKGDEDFTFKEVECGPRHLVIGYKDLEEAKDLINDKRFSTLLRVSLGKDDVVDSSVIEQLETIYMDFKFNPMEEHREKNQSEYQPSKEMFSINDKIIEDYVDKHNSELDKEDIMWGLRVLKNED